MNPRKLLLELFDSAVNAANPAHRLPEYLPLPPKGKTVVIGAGKAAASMAKALEDNWPGELSGLVVTPYGYGLPCARIEVIEAAHPVPDGAGEKAARRILELVAGLTGDDLVICLISGGGSSLLSLPAEGVSLEDKRTLNRALLKSGASIAEINCVRKHLSAIKGGRLAKQCAPARVVTLAVSDVPGDAPDIIASGPTVADPTTSGDALAVLKQYGITVPRHIQAWLESAESESVKPGDADLANNRFTIITKAQQSLEAAAKTARKQGYASLILSDCIEGEAREVAKVHAAIVRQVLNYGQPVAAPCVIISGGETTVTVRGNGRGGRNGEFILSLLKALRGQVWVYAIAADTDGIDGSEDNAGCILTPESFQRALDAGIDLNAMLANNDSYSVFAKLNDLVVTGPTRTNVNDFRAIVVL
jgi:hydroxypyruvate reductase